MPVFLGINHFIKSVDGFEIGIEFIQNIQYMNDVEKDAISIYK
jgi:hypothetical protein